MKSSEHLSILHEYIAELVSQQAEWMQNAIEFEAYQEKINKVNQWINES